MKKINLLFVLIISWVNLFANENYISGEIVNLNNEIIKGFINDKDWIDSPDEIEFKNNLQDEAVIFNPEEIKSFKTTNSYYISANVDIIEKENKNQTSNLPRKAEPSYYNKTVFLKVLLESDVSLYLYTDDKSLKHLFIKTSENDLMELINFKYISYKQEDKTEYVRENNKYIGQLRYLLKDCQEINNGLTSLSYSSRSILKLIRKYNNCMNNEITFILKKDKFKLEPHFSVNAGIGISAVSFSSELGNVQLQNLSKSDFSYSISPTIGLTGDFMFPYLNKKFGLNVNVNLLNYNVTGNSVINQSQRVYEKNNEINLTYLGTVIGLKYITSFKRVKPYLLLGLTNSFVINKKTKTTTKITYYSIERYADDQEILDEIRTHAQGFTLEAGFEYSWFVFGVKYLKDNGVSTVSTLSSTNKSLSFLLGYKF